MIRMRISWEKLCGESNRSCLWLQALLLQLWRTEGCLPFSFFSQVPESTKQPCQRGAGKGRPGQNAVSNSSCALCSHSDNQTQW